MFKSARIKLTAYYLFVIMLITLSFSGILYSSVTRQTQKALETQERRMRSRIYNSQNTPQHMMQPLIDEEEAKEMRMKTLLTLGVLNIAVLLISGFPGYWLAGKTLEPIEKMIYKQKKFVADAAHELKTPLTAIKTELEVNLRDKNLNIKKAKSLLESTIKDVDSLTLLANTLIKQSKYQSRGGNNKSTFSLKDLIQEAYEKLEPKAKEKGIDVKITGEEINLHSDRNAISEVVTIFLDNAIKFNKDKGAVSIKYQKKDHNAYIKIKDTGWGIEEKDLPHIFDRFYKADSSRSKSGTDGFGLGLSIAKDIIESEGGSISVESKKDKGTEFLIKLPCSQ